MVIKELKELIGSLPDNTEVILQKDSEGNGYSPLAIVDPDAIYVEETGWSGEVFSTDWSADDADMSEEEWADLLKKPRCVVLAPVN